LNVDLGPHEEDDASLRLVSRGKKRSMGRGELGCMSIDMAKEGVS